MGVKGTGEVNGSFTAMLGREVLHPVGTAKVLARFDDGKPAYTVNTYGKGKAYIAGVWTGLEYSYKIRRPSFDLTRDFDPIIGKFATAPATNRVKPVVDVSRPCVESVLLKNPKTGKHAVTLANWAAKPTGVRYTTRKGQKRVSGFLHGTVTFKNVTVRIRGAGTVRKVTSAWLQKSLPIKRDGEWTVVTLPTLEEGDILLVE